MRVPLHQDTEGLSIYYRVSGPAEPGEPI